MIQAHALRDSCRQTPARLWPFSLGAVALCVIIGGMLDREDRKGRYCKALK